MFKRSGSVTRFTVSGSMPAITDDAFTEALATRRFRSIEAAASEEVSFGWVTAEDPSGNSFDREDLDFEVAVWLRVRIDKKKLPATWLRIHRAIAQKAAGRPLSVKEKREVKEELEEKLLPSVLPTVQLIDAAYFPREQCALLLSTSSAVREVFDKLFRETFAVELEPQTHVCWRKTAASPRADSLPEPGAAGPVARRQRRAPDAATCRPPRDRTGHRVRRRGRPRSRRGTRTEHGGQRQQWPRGARRRARRRIMKRADELEFLGEEFLTWLWFRIEEDGGDFEIDRRHIAVSLDDYLAFAPRSDEDTEQTLRKGLPSRSAEARTALANGCRLRKAKLIVAEGERQWALTVDGPSMALSSIKLPEDSEECESGRDRNIERMQAFLEIHQRIEDLYRLFLADRLRDDYRQTTGERQATWMLGSS